MQRVATILLIQHELGDRDGIRRIEGQLRYPLWRNENHSDRMVSSPMMLRATFVLCKSLQRRQPESRCTPLTSWLPHGDSEASEPAMADAGKQPLWPSSRDLTINTDGDDGSH